MPVTALVKQTCAGCLTPIRDRYVLNVMNECWHESCLQCELCRVPLTGSCFSCGGKFYCKHDYEQLSTSRCAGCHQTIPPQELVMKVDNNHIFHLPCFCCVVCRQLLQKGQQFVVKDGQLLCRQHYETEFIFCPVSPTSDTSDCCYDDADNDELDSTKGPKRPRTILTTGQRRKFKASFEMNPKPCRKVRESLAAETGLTVRVVQVWFQNQRAKVKKLERKQNTENKNKEHNKINNNKKCQGAKRDPGRHSNETHKFTDNKQEQDSDFDYCADNHSRDGFVITNYSSPDNSNSFYPDIVLDIKDRIDHLDLLLSNSRGHDRQKVVTSDPTPMDKLYSMQMSYFCSK
ncbi:unnamed protein product [Candidula unifasciata]|uniref:Uncharacterized protein n=1 Tax=Candidula unifasciata TaxID=100452 RepID=A0A8S3ZIE6_9EUPU|nr:unnamed protein product [Candidula unifasciata]